MANIGAGNVELKALIYDNSATKLVFSLQNIRLTSGDSQSIADGTIILEENDELQVQAATADDF
jgi:hypothetical protein